MAAAQAPGRATSSRPGGPTRGRPRSEHTERAILVAVTALLAERGLADITMDEVAARAGVSKASVYRRWPSKGTLAFDAFMAAFLERQPSPDSGDLGRDLLAALRSWARAVRRPTTGRTLKGLIAEIQSDPELADAWRERFVIPVRARHRLLAERAIQRGELSPTANVDLLLDLLFGPAYHRLIQGHGPLNDAFIRGVVGAVMAAVETGAI